MRLAVSVLVFLASGSALAAQAADPECLAGIPATALAPVTVYFEADEGPGSRPVPAAADTLARLVAQVIRASFGAGALLPHADVPLHWRQLGHGVDVALHPDGTFTWTTSHSTGDYPTSQLQSDSAYNPARDLIVQALLVVRDAGIRLLWPRATSDDSLVFRLGYVTRALSPEGRMLPFEPRSATPVFSLPAPWERPLSLRRMPTVQYPEASRQRLAEGTVILRFVVDSAGRVRPGTIREHWTPSQPRLRSDLGMYYRAFVQTAVRSVTHAEFTPALVGGCAVEQLTEMPFVFELSR